jgi:hypothetical protein
MMLGSKIKTSFKELFNKLMPIQTKFTFWGDRGLPDPSKLKAQGHQCKKEWYDDRESNAECIYQSQIFFIVQA